MLSTGEQGQPYCAVVARVLVVIAEAVHVLVPPLAVADTAGKGTEAAFSLTFNLPHLAFGDGVVLFACGLSCRALACEECLYLLEVLWGRKVAAPVGHMVLEPVCLLVALVAIWLWTAERF